MAADERERGSAHPALRARRPCPGTQRSARRHRGDDQRHDRAEREQQAGLGVAAGGQFGAAIHR